MGHRARRQTCAMIVSHMIIYEFWRPELWWKKLKVKPMNRSGEPMIRLITATFEEKDIDIYKKQRQRQILTQRQTQSQRPRQRQRQRQSQ